MFVFLEGETTLKLEAKAHGKLKRFNVDVRSSSYYDYSKMGMGNIYMEGRYNSKLPQEFRYAPKKLCMAIKS